MTIERFYPIGTPGQPWTADDKAAWYAGREIQRSYRDEVLAVLDRLGSRYEVEQYGALSVDPERYPLFAVTCRSTDASAPWALITGGVHGYETSGVQGSAGVPRNPGLRTTQSGFNLLVDALRQPVGLRGDQPLEPATASTPTAPSSTDSPSEEAASTS